MKNYCHTALGLTLVCTAFGCSPQAPAKEATTNSGQVVDAKGGHDDAQARDSNQEPDAPGPAKVTNSTGESKLNAPQVWSDFSKDYNAHSAGSWTRGQPLFVLDNPGAFIRVRSFESLESLLQTKGEFDALRIKKLQFSAALSEGEIPKTNCESDQKLSGVYLGSGDAADVQRHIDNLEKYNLSPPKEVEALRAQWAALSPQARFSIVDLDHDVTFYFGESEAGPVLLAIDAVVPCSA